MSTDLRLLGKELMSENDAKIKLGYDTIKRFIRQRDKITDQLERVILKQIELVAEKQGITKITFGLCMSCEKDGREVECDELAVLDQTYYDCVGKSIMGLWEKGKGWV